MHLTSFLKEKKTTVHFTPLSCQISFDCDGWVGGCSKTGAREIFCGDDAYNERGERGRSPRRAGLLSFDRQKAEDTNETYTHNIFIQRNPEM